jgi:hypothetical protein
LPPAGRCGIKRKLLPPRRIFVTHKRKHERTECQTEAEIRYQGSCIKGKVENLSLKGLFVRTEQKIDVDEQVEIGVYFHGLESELSFSLQATVVRVSDEGIGFNFRKIDVESLALMRREDEYRATVNAG